MRAQSVRRSLPAAIAHHFTKIEYRNSAQAKRLNGAPMGNRTRYQNTPQIQMLKEINECLPSMIITIFLTNNVTPIDVRPLDLGT
ncbi:hypothetical protein [Bosea sp. Root381]|uniref:hypothetical protein n=1 Tax=Bosea sp. Root381 TaxID=1736524 RepID=UPI0012E3C388|nr:hypothetical protein [Bosea sp. Root381]